MSSHIVPLKTYFVIFGALMVLTVLTVGIAFVDLGFLNTFVAVTIAVVKALLVLLYFMHVKYSSKLTMVFAGAGFIWLLILVAFTMSDLLSRGWHPTPPGI